MNYAPARTIKLSCVLRAPHYSFINLVDNVEGGNGAKRNGKILLKRESIDTQR